MNNFPRRMVSVMALCVASLPWAHADQRDPTHASAGPTPAYHSAFDGYKPWLDVKLGDWRALNDAVRPGGMSDTGPMHDMGAPASEAGHMSHVHAPSAPASAAAPAPMASMPAHSHHHHPDGDQK